MNKESISENKYNHLSLIQKAQIMTLHNEHKNQSYIALQVWCSQPSVSRELSRNSVENWHGRMVYKADKAQALYKDRRTKANLQHRLLWKHKDLYDLIDSLLKQWYSPDVIANRIIKEETNYTISTPSIYNYINENKIRRKQCTFKHWYKKHWAKETRWKICPNLPKIDQRPQEINERTWNYDREVDSIVSLWHQWWLTTLTNRKHRFLLIKQALKLNSSITKDNVISMLIWHPVTSITADNGSEFAKLEEIQTELKTRCFLCHPYCSREKWSNEKNNREVRYHIPKKSNIHSYTQEQLQDIQDRINRKPRKILGYLSAHESYYWVRLTYLK